MFLRGPQDDSEETMTPVIVRPRLARRPRLRTRPATPSHARPRGRIHPGAVTDTLWTRRSSTCRSLGRDTRYQDDACLEFWRPVIRHLHLACNCKQDGVSC